MIRHAQFWGRVLFCGAALLTRDLTPAEAGGPFRRPPQRVVPTVHSGDAAVYPMLGTFYPTPYMIVRGNFPTGGGYSPLDQFGNTSLSLYGPLSSLRATTAPVLLVTRGYDGRLVPLSATSFSTPNL